MESPLSTCLPVPGRMVCAGSWDFLSSRHSAHATLCVRSALWRERHCLQRHRVLPGVPTTILQLSGLCLAHHRAHWSWRPSQPQPAADRALWGLHHRLVRPGATWTAPERGAFLRLESGLPICWFMLARVEQFPREAAPEFQMNIAEPSCDHSQGEKGEEWLLAGPPARGPVKAPVDM